MPIVDDVSPDILQPLFPLHKNLTPAWNHIVTGVARAPDPALAAVNLSRLLEHEIGTGEVLDSFNPCCDNLFVLGASQHLTNVLLSQGQDWEAAFLADRDATEKTASVHLSSLRTTLTVLALDLSKDDFRAGLRAYRNRKYLRIGPCDLLARASLEETTRDLSALAEAAVQIAYEYVEAQLTVDYGEAVVEEEAEPHPIEFVVLGMGKLGGEERNFSSDIDLIYLFECDTGMTTSGRKGQVNSRTFFTMLAQDLTRTLSIPIAGGIVFQVDLGLRPDGTNGYIVKSLFNTLLYYESWGQTWERAALLKARPIAGEKPIGQRFLHEVAPSILRRYLDSTTVEDLKDLKARVDRERMNVKLSRSGIREIEFVAQVLQLIHAGKDPRVLERIKLRVLDRLCEGAYSTVADRDVLARAYQFLHQVEHKIQIVQDPRRIPCQAQKGNTGLGTPSSPQWHE